MCQCVFFFLQCFFSIICSQCEDMAAASSFLSEDQLWCSICLSVFRDPVTIPCGHNFCKECITKNWNINVQCRCPMCDKHFDRRPELHVNTLISEMAAQLRQSRVKEITSSLEQQQAEPGVVLCDVCTKSRLKALKSCQVCKTSYCEIHLQHHHKFPGLRRHQLIDPVEDLEDRKS